MDRVVHELHFCMNHSCLHEWHEYAFLHDSLYSCIHAFSSLLIFSFLFFRKYSPKDLRHLCCLVYFSLSSNVNNMLLDYRPLHMLHPFSIPFSQLPSYSRPNDYNCCLVSLYIDASISNPNPPSTRSLRCIGLGFIRAVDYSRGCYHVLTPVPRHVLSGLLDWRRVEEAFWLSELSDSFTQGGRWLSEAQGANSRHVRHNIQRRGRSDGGPLA